MPPMIEIRGLRKVYKDLVAVKNLDLELNAGDIFGFIGPNGAGKTTTIKMLATLLLPSAGTAFIDGIDVIKDPDHIRGIVGYMPDFFGVYDDIKVWEYLDFFAAAYLIPRNKRPGIINDVLALTDLTVKKDAFVESLSRGMKQRLCLAKTLVHDPKVLLLDEPASGLDPRARIEIKELLKELRSMGKTIIISSHILPELADFCNKIGIIEKGEMIISGDVKEIIREVSGKHALELRIFRDEQVGLSNFEQENLNLQTSPSQLKAIELLAKIPNIEDIRLKDGLIQMSWQGEPNGEWVVLKMLIENDLRVLSFSSPPTDLEDVFLRVTRGIVN